MNRIYDHYQSYSWHQSHDQATVLLLVPYETSDDDVAVIIERNHIVAGVRGQAPILKGRLYGSVDVSNSMWQLESHTSRLSARERTTSSISTTSTQSSFAVVTDPEISSSFATSLEGGITSDPDELDLSSPALSSPISASLDDHATFPTHVPHRHQSRFTTSHPVSPRSAAGHALSLTSSFSSLESLHASASRLLTLHLEKAESVIWPSLIIGPVPEALAPSNLSVYPWASDVPQRAESKYNMDPTSLVLLALDLCNIRNLKEEAFEYFVRAWHQVHVPSATVRLSVHYLPLNTVIPQLQVPTTSDSSSTSTPSSSPCVTPTLSHMHSEPPALKPGTPAYYFYHIGGVSTLAQLYLEAGLLYLEGTASNLLSSSYAGLSSLRTSTQFSSHADTSNGGGTSGADAWRRDRDTARRFFERARRLDPDIDIPLLPPTPDTEASSDPESNNGHRHLREPSSGVESGADEPQLKMPSIEIHQSEQQREEKQVRRRRKKDELGGNASSASLVEEKVDPDDDNTWYLYLPGLVGAGTALLVVGFLSFSSWRKGQGS